MESIHKLQQYLRNMYIRYLLVTELYMVDTWEQIVVHGLMIVLFFLCWYFNYSIVMNGLKELRSYMGGGAAIREM